MSIQSKKGLTDLQKICSIGKLRLITSCVIGAKLSSMPNRGFSHTPENKSTMPTVAWVTLWLLMKLKICVQKYKKEDVGQ